MNRINQLFETKKSGVLNIFFTAGFPKLEDTLGILKALDRAGADMVEIGIPFSDPAADGPTIQISSHGALQNGITLKKIFAQLEGMRSQVKIPVLFMSYANVVMHYGMENFCRDCQRIGIDGVILPDLPMEVFEEEYRAMFNRYGIKNVYLVTPQSADERIRLIDKNSDAFIYVVSQDATTGTKEGVNEIQKKYFDRVNSLGLKNPTLIGFGITDKQTFDTVCRYARGGIIGSGFVKHLIGEGTSPEGIARYVKSIKG